MDRCSDVLWANLRIASQLVPMQDVVDWPSHVNHTVGVFMNKVVNKLHEKRKEAMISGV